MAKILKQNKPSKHKKAVVFCADRNVVRFAQFVAHQIMQAEPDRDYDICITTFDADLVDLDKISAEIRICQVEEEPFAPLATNFRIPSTAYILMALPALFAQDYTNIVYLDTDVFLAKGKISDLFEAANPDFAVSGVLDSTQWSGKEDPRKSRYWQLIGIDQKPYINTGVLVLDVPKCNTVGFYENSLNAALQLDGLSKDDPQVAFLHDQTAINMHLNGNWAPMSLRYNWQVSRHVSKLTQFHDPIILHFVATNKPWAKKPLRFAKTYLPEYIEFFETVLSEKLQLRHIQARKLDLVLTPWQRLVYELNPKKISERLNKINPLYYTGLRGLIPTYLTQKNVVRIEKAIKAGLPIWPAKAMRAALERARKP